MRAYELTFIIAPTVEEDALQPLIDNVTERITQIGGEISNTNLWGRRRLAYPIKKFNEGYYVLLTLQLPPESIKGIERDLLLSETIIRHLFVRIDE